MNRNLRRMLLALVISVSGYAATELWFKYGQRDANGDTRDPIAKLNDASNEVQRKPIKRVIWENVTKNDELFAGEAVRTAANAEAQILITKSGTTIRLDPDSLIVLEENDQGLSLDFLQGNMMVAGGEGDLTVKTGGGEIKMNSADLSLSKDQSGQVNLEIYKGQAELQQGNQKVALDKDKAAVLSEKGVSVSEDRIQLLAPKANEKILLNLTKGERVEVSWKTLPKGYSVTADTGPTRGRYTRMAVANAPGEAGKMSFSTKPGRWYLRLKADAEDANLPKLGSVIIPFIVQAKAAPTLIEPEDKAAIFKKAKDELTTFKWVNRHNFESQIIEVASDPQFSKDKIQFTQNLGGREATAGAPLGDGSYFWRVTGYLKNGEKLEALSSSPRGFSVSSNWQLTPPTLIYPANQQRLSFMEIQRQKGVNLKWQAPAGGKRYRVSVVKQTEAGSQSLMEQTTESTLARLTDIAPGTYLWKVSSLDEKDGSEKVSETFEFKIDELPPIEWAETNLNNEYEFTTPTPSLRAQWKPTAIPPTSYRYRVVAEGQPIQDGKWQTTKQTIFDISLPAAGSYQASVEALNASGQAIAASSVRTFTIRPRPLLPAPKWAENAPEELKSDARGNLSFDWQSVDGAKNYLMILESDEGQVLEQRAISRTTASLSRLKPGQYQVKLKSVDAHERPGPESEIKKIVVPNLSDIRAPKIRALKVK